MKSYTQLRNYFGTMTSNTTTSNLALADQLINDSTRYLIQKFNINERQSTTTTVAGQQYYDLPYNYKRLIDVTILVGSTLWTPTPVASRVQWDRLNQSSTPSSAYPQYYYIYNNQVGFWPKASSTGNTITFNQKVRTKDLSQADYTTGTVAVTGGSKTVTGTGTTFVRDMIGRWLQVSAPNGDNEWYEIAGFTSATVITLKQNYNGTTVSGATYTIGEMSILPEEYQDLPVIYALRQYYSGRVKELDTYGMYKDMYNEKYKMMNDELGSKDDNMVISMGVDRDIINPNLTITL